MNTLAYIARELAHGIAHSFSGSINVIFFRGSYHQSTSARAHLEQAHPAWANRRRFINALFFWQDDHCRMAWEADYSRALAKVNANRPW